MKLEYGMKVRVNDGYGCGMVGILKSQSYRNMEKYIEVQDINSETHWMLYFVSADNKNYKTFTLGNATEALKYLLLDDVGRERKDGKQ